MLVLPGCQRFGHPPRNKQGSSEGDLFIELAASNILSRATHYCKSAIVVPALSHQLPSNRPLRSPCHSLSLPSPNDRTAACLGGHGEVRRMDANRIAVMRIQASYTVHRYAFLSVIALVQQRLPPSRLIHRRPASHSSSMCTVHVGDMPTPWSRPHITPLPGHNSVVCVKPTAQLAHSV